MIKLNDRDRSILEPNNFSNFWLTEYINNEDKTIYKIKSYDNAWYYKDEQIRHKDYERIYSLKNSQKNGGVNMETLKGYFGKHSESLITLGIIIIIDEYLFGGAFRDKIKEILDKMLKKTADRIEKEK